MMGLFKKNFLTNVLTAGAAFLGIKDPQSPVVTNVLTAATALLPQSPVQNMAMFRLYTRSTTGATTISEKGWPNFNGANPTKFIIHGFKSHGSAKWISDMRNAMLKLEDINVVVVDWAEGAKKEYPLAAYNTRVVGAQLARFMTSLRTEGGAMNEDMHLIAHSLGAHVAGYAGESIKRIGRITGLDPAGLLFERISPKLRLDRTDATFVDVIHTSGLGIKQAIGDVDFFPNWGVFQPGCKKKSIKKSVSCSHSRAHAYFTESINSTCTFQACTIPFRRCTSMGYHADRNNTSGKYYLTTGSSSPFCIA